MERLVNTATDQAADAAPFRAYTVFPAAERQLERHLGPAGKLVLSERQQLGFVRLVPWILLAFIPFQLVGVAVLLGVSALTAVADPGASIASAVLGSAGFVLSVVALPGLFRRSRVGWAFYMYSIIVGLLSSMLSLSLLGTLISVVLVWLMFQVKYRYA
jgi:hypothetical protein